jgi:hypothetical protein
MRLRPVDVRYGGRTIADAGGEDRALLRSNPSAHAGAGTRAGVCLHSSPLPSPTAPTRSGHKAITLGVWGRAPRQHPGPVGHMSRLPGWRSSSSFSACLTGRRSCSPRPRARRSEYCVPLLSWTGDKLRHQSGHKERYAWQTSSKRTRPGTAGSRSSVGRPSGRPRWCWT